MGSNQNTGLPSGRIPKYAAVNRCMTLLPSPEEVEQPAPNRTEQEPS